MPTNYLRTHTIITTTTAATTKKVQLSCKLKHRSLLLTSNKRAVTKPHEITVKFIFLYSVLHGEGMKGRSINCETKVECHDIIIITLHYCMAGASNLKVTALQL